MQDSQLDKILVELRGALEQNDLSGAVSIIEQLHSSDQADVFYELDDEEQMALLPEMDTADSADLLEELDDTHAAELVEALDPEDAIRIVDEMEPDEAADVLGAVSPEQAEILLAGLEDPDEIRPLLLHPDDSAGGLMTSEFLALRQRMTAGEAIKALREWGPSYEDIPYLFIIDRYQTLCGVINLGQLILANPNALLMDIMETDIVSVLVGSDQEHCAYLMARYDLIILPVVDENKKLLGLITIDDIVDVLEEEATEDIQRFGGAEPLPIDRSYLDTSVLTIMRKRISWLLLLFITESLTGTVLRHFEDKLQAAVALSFFIPLLIGTGGNAGSQTTSTIIRALAVGDVTLRDGLHTLWHEFRTGVLLGLGLAIIAYVRAWSWGSGQPIALTVSVSVFVIVVWANSLGALLPMLATWLKIDPSLVSGPVMSTLVDATGLFIYFTLAGFILGV